MKKTLLFIALGAVAAAAQAEESGRVISSVPVIQQVAVPRQVCNQQQVLVQPQQSSGGGALLGAVVGGLLGNTIGHGNGRAAATGIGIVGGAAVGDNVERRGNGPVATTQQTCSTQTFYENRTVGYNVTYEYAGKQYQVQMPYDPGPTVRLQVTPVGGSSMPPPPPAPQPLSQAPVVEQSVAVLPAAVPSPYIYPAVAYPSYYYRPYYPVGLSLSFGYVGGWHGGHRGYHGHRGHWR